MSPAPSRTSVDAIVAAARRILETDGLAAVTMRSVAEAVGVQGPSLYKRVPDRAALIRAVAEGVVADLAGTLARATETGDPHTDLRSVADAYRDFVHRNPNGYRLLFADLPAGAGPDPAALAALADPIVKAMAALSGEADRARRRSDLRGLGARIRLDGAGRSVPAGRRPRRGLCLRDRVDPGRRQVAGDPSVTLRMKSTNKNAMTSASAPMSLG